MKKYEVEQVFEIKLLDGKNNIHSVDILGDQNELIPGLDRILSGSESETIRVILTNSQYELHVNPAIELSLCSDKDIGIHSSERFVLFVTVKMINIDAVYCIAIGNCGFDEVRSYHKKDEVLIAFDFKLVKRYGGHRWLRVKKIEDELDFERCIKIRNEMLL